MPECSSLPQFSHRSRVFFVIVSFLRSPESILSSVRPTCGFLRTWRLYDSLAVSVLQLLAVLAIKKIPCQFSNQPVYVSL